MQIALVSSVNLFQMCNEDSNGVVARGGLLLFLDRCIFWMDVVQVFWPKLRPLESRVENNDGRLDEIYCSCARQSHEKESV